MKAKNLGGLFLLTVMVFAGSLGTTGIALAESTPTTTITQKTLTTTINHHLVSATSLAEGKVTVLSFVKAHGLTKKQRNSSNCRTIGAGTDVPAFWNSGLDANGVLFWFRDSRFTHICKVHGVWRKVGCGNLIRFHAPHKHIITGKVIMVRTFAHVVIKVRAWVHVKATADCGSAEAMASASARVRLRILVKARGSAAIKLWAKAQAHAVAKANAHITCTVPPGEQPPELSNATQPQEVFADGETISICVTSSSKNGDSVTVGFGAKFGSFSPSNQPFVSDGTNVVCSTYTAPDTPDAAGLQEVVTFTVHDNDTGLNGKSIFVSFPIKAPPTPPN